uniref:sialic acid-binding Ig-like lectin 12 n=1 Tax=Myxine glutinosa TaxID=7769 RepID=UPI00358F85EC
MMSRSNMSMDGILIFVIALFLLASQPHSSSAEYRVSYGPPASGYVGGTAELSCRLSWLHNNAYGYDTIPSPKPSGQWFKLQAWFQTTILKSLDKRFSVAGDPQKYGCTLQIRELKGADAGIYEYRLDGTEERLVKKQGILLSVYATPAISTTTNVSLVGQPTMVHCEVRAKPRTTLSLLCMEVARNQTRTSFLWQLAMVDIRFPAKRGGGTCSCTLHDARRNLLTSSIKQLYVQDFPSLHVEPTILLANHTISIICHVFAYVPLSLVVHCEENSGQTSFVSATNDQTALSYLNFTVSAQQSGTACSCGMYKDPGKKLLATTKLDLDVQYEPRNLEVNGSLVVASGSPLRLLFQADARPPAQLRWLIPTIGRKWTKEQLGINLSEEEKHLKSEMTETGGQVPIGLIGIGTQLELNIQSVSEKDGGAYFCLAHNVHGVSTTSVFITVSESSAKHLSLAGGLIGGFLVLICIVLAGLFTWMKLWGGRDRSTDQINLAASLPDMEVYNGFSNVDQPQGLVLQQGQDCSYINLEPNVYEVIPTPSLKSLPAVYSQPCLSKDPPEVGCSSQISAICFENGVSEDHPKALTSSAITGQNDIYSEIDSLEDSFEYSTSATLSDCDYTYPDIDPPEEKLSNSLPLEPQYTEVSENLHDNVEVSL